jgi:AcrR family transcriptional regulator
LREALLKEARRQLRKLPPSSLSLKRLANAVGVSHAAPYRHFKNIEALLDELVVRGFAEFDRALEAAFTALPDSGRQQFLDAGFAVVAFALRHPEQYRLMFSGVRGNHLHELAAAPRRRAFGRVLDQVDAWQATGLLREAPATDVAMTLYATTHGIASLLSSGQLRLRSVVEVRKLADRIHGMVLDGLRR